MSNKVEELAGKLLGKLGMDVNSHRGDHHQSHGNTTSTLHMPSPELMLYQGQRQPTGVGPSYAPPLPPRVNVATKPQSVLALPNQEHTTGALYVPGTYPTPDLFPFPLGNHIILSNPTSFTSSAIQEALDSLGPQSTLYLPKRSRWSVSSTIFLKPYQEIATEGYPTSGEEMAWLDAAEELDKQVLSGINTAGVRIRNIGIDGGREKYGYLKVGQCTVQLGGAQGEGKVGGNQVIDHCIIQHPRQWSCLQALEGGQNVRITNNFIGPAGYDAYSGPSGQWADGISYAASNGLVAGNQILDATDGGIVVFGAPGTLVTSNTIIVRSRVALGAINMVDYDPHAGSYQFTRVIHNTIRAEGSFLKLGVGQGNSCWFNPPPPTPETPRKYLRGAIIMNNLIESADGKGQVGYGFGVSDVEDWICTGNASPEGVDYDGVWAERTSDGKMKVPPGPFVKSHSTKDGTCGPKGRSKFQLEFVEGKVLYLIGIQPGHSDMKAFAGGQLRLRPGDRISLQDVRLEFGQDGEVKLVRSNDGTPIWVFNQPHHPITPNTKLMFTENGKFGIVEEGEKMVVDLTPNLPFSGIQDLPNEPRAKATLTILGNNGGRLTIASPKGSVILAAPSYIVTHNYELLTYPMGPFISRPSASGRSTIVTLLSPFGRLVILESAGGVEMDLPIRFGDKIRDSGEIPVEGRWRVIWSSTEPKKEHVDSNGRDENGKMYFQGDGNIVVYSTKGSAVWSSGTHVVKPVLKWMKFGSGMDGDPYLELSDESGKVGWKV